MSLRLPDPLTLVGGPLDGKVIDHPPFTRVVQMPVMRHPGTNAELVARGVVEWMRFDIHQYDRSTGEWLGVRLDEPYLTWPDIELFPRWARLAALMHRLRTVRLTWEGRDDE